MGVSLKGRRKAWSPCSVALVVTTLASWLLLSLVLLRDTAFPTFVPRQGVDDVASRDLSTPSLKQGAGVEARWVRRREGSMCSLRDAELSEVMAKPHGSTAWRDRYYYSSRWMTVKELVHVTEALTVGEIVCVIVHVEGQAPCKKEDCVLHFHVRAGDSDVHVLEQLLDKKELEGLDENADFRTILDGGGNCGIAAVLFATQYPNARIVSVEPALSSYNVLRMNVAPFPNVIPIRAGLWNRVTTLGLFRSPPSIGLMGDAAWGMQVKEIPSSPSRASLLERLGLWAKEAEGEEGTFVDTLDGLSIPFLLRVAGMRSFDLVKIDIEGSEKELFEPSETSDGLAYLRNVRVAMIEVHEHFRSGALASVASAFATGFRESQFGEYKVFTREDR